jgi:hypothetical protein
MVPEVNLLYQPVYPANANAADRSGSADSRADRGAVNANEGED